MDSVKKTSDNKSKQDDKNNSPNKFQTDEQLQPTAKCHLLHKAFWNPFTEIETFCTLVNYHHGHKVREAWSKLIAAMNAKKLLKIEKETEEDDEVYNLGDLFQTSNEKLGTSKSNTILNFNYSPTSEPDGSSRQSIKVKICNMPAAGQIGKTNKQTETEGQLAKSDKTRSKKPLNNKVIVSCKSDFCCQRKLSKCKLNESTYSLKWEIFNLPPLQEGFSEEIKTPKITQILQQQPKIIAITDDEEGDGAKTEIVQAIENLTEVSYNTSEMCNTSCKSTQKPDALAESPTQTSLSGEIKQKLPKSLALTYKQRQLELHRLRVQVEQRRLELLDLKLSREHDNMKREKLIFEKGLTITTFSFNKLLNDDTSTYV